MCQSKIEKKLDISLFDTVVLNYVQRIFASTACPGTHTVFQIISIFLEVHSNFFTILSVSKLTPKFFYIFSNVFLKLV